MRPVPQAEPEYLQVGPVKLAYKEYGKDPRKVPLVMVNGVSSIGTIDFQPIDTKLAKSRPVVVLDNRGIGRSVYTEDTDEDLTIHAMAGDVIALVKHLGYTKIDLLGYSMGGIIAQTVLYSERPFEISHLILVATFTRNPVSTLGKTMVEVASMPRETPEQRKQISAKTLETMYHPAYFEDPANKDLFQWRVETAVAHKRNPATILEQVQAISILGDEIHNKALSSRRDLPVLILHGSLDKVVSLEHAKADLEQVYPHAVWGDKDAFGHLWSDYFGEDYWVGLINRFLDDKHAKL